MTPLPLLLNIILQVLAMTVRHEKDIKGTQIGNEEVKLSLFTDNMSLYMNMYIENPLEVHCKTMRTNKQVQQGCRNQEQHQKSIVFLSPAKKKL